MKRYTIEHTKPVSKDKQVMHQGIPLVRFSKSEQELLKTVFGFYIGFPLHSGQNKYVNAQKLFDKINLSVSTLKSNEIKIVKNK